VATKEEVMDGESTRRVTTTKKVNGKVVSRVTETTTIRN
jgi:hypothetical protein